LNCGKRISTIKSVDNMKFFEVPSRFMRPDALFPDRATLLNNNKNGLKITD